MTTHDSRVTTHVYYEGTPQTRFDRAYYADCHLPLCVMAWNQYGLLRISAFFPAVGHSGAIAICDAVFRDKAAVDAALNAPDVTEIMADVARYTDATPVRVRAVAL